MTDLDVAIWEFEELVACDALVFDASGTAACGCQITDMFNPCPAHQQITATPPEGTNPMTMTTERSETEEDAADRPPFIVVVGNRDTIEAKLTEAFVRGYTPKLMSATGDGYVRLTHVLCEHADVRSGAF